MEKNIRVVGVVKHWTLAWRLRSKELQVQKSFGDEKFEDRLSTDHAYGAF